jgi:hypothetical protein
MSSAYDNQTMIPPVLRLPTEVAAQIFSYLRLKDIVRARQVCWLWTHQASPMAYKEMRLTLCKRYGTIKPFLPNYPRILLNFRFTSSLSLNFEIRSGERPRYIFELGKLPLRSIVQADDVDAACKHLVQLREIVPFLPERMKVLNLSFHSILAKFGCQYREYQLFETIRDILAKITDPDARKIDKVKVFLKGKFSREGYQININDLFNILHESMTEIDVELNSLDFEDLHFSLPNLKSVTLQDSPCNWGDDRPIWELFWSLDKFTLKYEYGTIPLLPNLADTLTELNIFEWEKFSRNAITMAFFQFSNLQHLCVHTRQAGYTRPPNDLFVEPIVSTQLRSVTIYSDHSNHVPAQFYRSLGEQCPQLKKLIFCSMTIGRLLSWLLKNKRDYNNTFDPSVFTLFRVAIDDFPAGGIRLAEFMGQLGYFLLGVGGKDLSDYILYDGAEPSEYKLSIWELTLTNRRPVDQQMILKVNYESEFELRLCRGCKVGDEVKIFQFENETWDDVSAEKKTPRFWQFRLVSWVEFRDRYPWPYS